MGNEITVQSLISKDEREQLYKILYIGITAYNRLLDENRHLEASQFFSEIKTRILNFTIKRQFEEDMLVKDFPFKIDIKDVNAFKSKALFVENSFTRIKIASTPKVNKFVTGSKIPKYMLRESQKNSRYTKKIRLFILKNNDVEIREEKEVFMILGYGIKNRDIEHLNFMIPEEDMKSTIDSFNAMNEYYETVMVTENDDYTEKKIVALKNEAKKLIN